MQMSEKQTALQRIQQDIYKKISVAIDIAKQCDITVILMAVVDFHFRRIRTYENKEEKPSVQAIESFINLDSIKYVMQMVIKFGRQKFPNYATASTKYFKESWNHYQLLCSKANEISSGNEALSLLELTPDVSFVNANLVRSDMSSITPEMQKFLEYGARSDYLNNVKKKKIFLPLMIISIFFWNGIKVMKIYF